MMLALLLSLPAWAEIPPPDYRDALLAQAEARADNGIAGGHLEAALVELQAFREIVADDARLVYETGLLHRLLGHDDQAEALYRQALELDAGLAFAWYDLGELQLERGALDDAKASFQACSDRTSEHPNGWAGPMRLAEIAGREQDAEAFDRALKEAVRRGFAFRLVASDPTWTGFWGVPALAEVMTRLMQVYGEEALLESWGPGQR